MSGLGGEGLTPGRVEPRAKRPDSAGVDSRAAPDADVGRRIAITRHVIGRLFAFQQPGQLLAQSKLGFVVETIDRMIGELEADRKTDVMGKRRSVRVRLGDGWHTKKKKKKIKK